MGQSTSTDLSKESLAEYESDVRGKLTKEDIKSFHKLFFEMFPSGKMDREGCVKFCDRISAKMTPEQLFRTMDRDKNGEVTFKEFLVFVSIAHPTTSPIDPNDLMEMVFHTYDEDNDGYVTREEMINSIINARKARGLDVSSPEEKDRVKARVETLLKLADRNGDEKLTLEELLDATRRDPTIMKIF